MTAGDDSDVYAQRALLPAGFRDELPPMAEFEAGVVNRLMECFRSFGYERVIPPLIEFEDSLLAFDGSKHANQMFRFLDPESQRMMAARADMTLQVARIATTRLKKAPRPLRLSYAGPVLRVAGSQLRPSRQFRQAGVELIGSPATEADVEIIALAHEALRTIGVPNPSFDLATPRLLPTIAPELGLDAAAISKVVAAFKSKQMACLDSLSDSVARILKGMLDSAGNAGDALASLSALPLPGSADPILETLELLIDRLGTVAPGLHLTVDPCELRGFEYKTGVAFSIFSSGARGELGRGGRYRAAFADDSGEDAVGFSIYLDSVMQAVQPDMSQELAFAPAGISFKRVRELRSEGWRIVAGLEPVSDPENEARRLGCSHIVPESGDPQALRQKPARKG